MSAGIAGHNATLFGRTQCSPKFDDLIVNCWFIGLLTDN